jgi:hypothetical protein
MRERLEALDQKLSRYMTMTPLSNIEIPVSNGTYKIPDAIPKHATHVLLYARVHTGSAGNSTEGEIIFSNTLQHEHRFYYFFYPQNAVSYNSESIWIEICHAREIIISGVQIRTYSVIKFYLVAYK